MLQARHVQPFSLHRTVLSAAGELIACLDALRANPSLRDLRLDFPRIVVLGEESAGKSSLLERIAMTEFFPKGNDICTRAPIVLNLKHISVAEAEEMCKKHGIKFTTEQLLLRVGQQNKFGAWSTNVPDFEQEMLKFMNSVVVQQNGKVTGVTDVEITVEVVGYVVPNLTLVDLPGLIGGRLRNEPEDMHEQTMALARKYIRHPHTLVLAVIPADARPRNTLTARLIQETKKEDFTLGVLTKADRANTTGPDRFAELRARLDNVASDTIPLPHGWLAVRNRDSRIMPMPSLQEFATGELDWFASVLPGYDEKKCVGSNALIERVVRMLCKHVAEKWVPDAERQLQAERSRLNTLAAKLGDDPLAGDVNSFAERLSKHWKQDIQAILQPTSIGEVLLDTGSAKAYDLRHAGPPNISTTTEAEQWRKRKIELLGSSNTMISCFIGDVKRTLERRLACEELPLRCSRFSVLRDRIMTSFRDKLGEIETKLCAKACQCMDALFPLLEAINQSGNLVSPILVIVIEEFTAQNATLLRIIDTLLQQPNIREWIKEDEKSLHERKEIVSQIRQIDQLLLQVQELRKFGSATDFKRLLH